MVDVTSCPVSIADALILGAEYAGTVALSNSSCKEVIG
jgi:hypothetical protein